MSGAAKHAKMNVGHVTVALMRKVGELWWCQQWWWVCGSGVGLGGRGGSASLTWLQQKEIVPQPVVRDPAVPEERDRGPGDQERGHRLVVCTE